jgi:hypothetical protein
VLERINGVGRRAALKHQLRGDEAGERGLQLVFGKAGYCAQQRVGEFASDRRADLRNPSEGRQAIEPRRAVKQSRAERILAPLRHREVPKRSADGIANRDSLTGGPRVRIPVPFKAVIGWSAL